MTKKVLALGMVLSVFGASKATLGEAGGDKALNAIRIINTAEVYAYSTGTKYLPLGELISSGSLRQAAGMNESFAATYSELNLQHGTELINGFDFALVVSSDGTAYKLSILQKGNCGAAYFSDEHGIIYAGKALGCSAQ